jgi:hypothetical protein
MMEVALQSARSDKLRMRVLHTFCETRATASKQNRGKVILMPLIASKLRVETLGWLLNGRNYLDRYCVERWNRSKRLAQLFGGQDRGAVEKLINVFQFTYDGDLVA